jgi:hypothetical protein
MTLLLSPMLRRKGAYLPPILFLKPGHSLELTLQSLQLGHIAHVGDDPPDSTLSSKIDSP